MIEPETLGGTVALSMMADRDDTVWIAGSRGIIERTAEGKIRKYTERDGLPDEVVRALRQDRDGNIWAGTNNGFARLEGKRVATPTAAGGEMELVGCRFQDRDGNRWIGSYSGLDRMHSD